MVNSISQFFEIIIFQISRYFLVSATKMKMLEWQMFYFKFVKIQIQYNFGIDPFYIQW